ncbi:MAG TPA: DUF29 domain-containing protein [Beijerinckiaceae bacterium]|jgi:hypothetical protein
MPLATKKPKQDAPEAQATYQGDFYTWTREQGALLRAGRFDAIDWENIAEEIESLGRTEFDKLVSFYALIMLHMLKWEHQPNLRSRSWAISIENHREHAAEVLNENPGLKSRLDEALERAYRRARGEAIAETGLWKSTFPDTCPFTLDEVLTRPYEFD